jgi:hypothetical protein
LDDAVLMRWRRLERIVTLARGPQLYWGDGGLCAGCGLEIFMAQVKYELEVGSPDRGATLYPLHLACFGLWQATLYRLGHNPGSGSGG